MASIITPRTGEVPGGTPVDGTGIGTIQLTNVAGTDTITADSVPDMTDWALYQTYFIRPFAINTGAVTVNVRDGDGDLIGARDWVKPDGSAYLAAELSPNLEYMVKYNGTHLRTLFGF